MLHAEPGAPAAARKHHVRDLHGEQVDDPWFWLRDRENPEVIAYVEAENAYWDRTMAGTAELQNTVFEEIKSRVLETDQSVPARKGDWWYITRTVEGLNYPVHCRRRDPAEETAEEIVLDENVLANGHEYFELGLLDVSPDGRLAAYATDTDGSEVFALRFKDLATGELLADVIDGIVYGSAWSLDSTVFFYVKPDECWRQHQVWRHVLGSRQEQDVCVFEEADDRFWLSLDLTRSGQYAVLHTSSRSTSEVRMIPMSEPLGEPFVVEPRTPGLEYAVEHQGGRFLVVTNLDAPNFRLVEAPVDTPGRENWVEVIGHHADVKFEGVDAFQDHVIVYQRAGGLPTISVLFNDGRLEPLSFIDEVYDASAGGNLEYATREFRFVYSSPITPDTLFEHNVVSGERRVLKQLPVLGGYDSANYRCAREWAVAPDGERVPIAVVWKADTPLDGSAPCVVYGYGSYESIIPDQFSSVRLSLLDRGCVYAVAHPRGGGEMGRRWWDDGKLANKLNTFVDFAACVRHVVARQYCAADRVAIHGGSAGGLLVGATMALYPGLVRAVVADVPFVDIVNTMLDASIPLTTGEWEEWGNPAVEQEYHWMQAYNPYERVSAREFPSLYVTAGLHDPRVQYWEPLKWVAKIRTLDTGSHPIILRTEMGAGHGGPSGRYELWRDMARVYAFLFHELAIVD